MAQQQRSGGPAGSALSAICGLLSVLLVPVAIVALWASFTLTRTDAFVDDMGPIATNPEVQQAVTDGVVDGVLQTLDLRPAIESAVEDPLRRAVTSAVESPEFETVWITSLGSTHRQFIAAMERRDGARVDDQGRLVLSLSVPIPNLSATLSSLGVAAPETLEPTVAIPLLSAADLEQARSVYAIVDAAGLWAPVAAVALAILCIALARDRSRAAIRLALAWGVVAVLLGLAIVVLREHAVAAAGGPASVAIVDAAYGIARQQLFTGIGIVLVLALLTMVVAGLSRGRKELS